MSDTVDDVLEKVYNLLASNNYIKNKVTSAKDGLKIRYFRYPETADMSGNWIVLEPIINERPSDFADEVWLAYDYLLHVEVWSKNRKENRELSNYIRDILWNELSFVQNDDIDEYDSGIYRDARRYKGKRYRSDLDTI